MCVYRRLFGVFATASRSPLISPSMSAALPVPAAWQLGCFAAALAFFHGSEYGLAAAFHGHDQVTAESLLISKQYIMAMSFAFLEYVTESLLLPELKHLWLLSSIGIFLIVFGEIIRKAAVITAGRSFTHIIRIYYSDDHKLITNGIYGFMRHPGYCGFFFWVIGTQLLLCNPVSLILFTLIIWRFFSKRIPYEEFFLKQFFGPEYEEYVQRVPSGIPLVK